MPNYNVRGSVGKQKGKFIKRKVKAKLDKLLETVKTRSLPKSKVPAIFSGRRIVELDKIAEELWCKPCNRPLSLRLTIKEKKEGLASHIHVKCEYCSTITQITTSSKTSKKPYFDVNLKLAVGMYDSGMGERGVNTFLSALNIPAVGSTSLKRYETEVGPAILDLAEQSCSDSIELEKKLTHEICNDPENNGNYNPNTTNVIDLTASYDAAWTKRGRQYNSLSGHGSLIGNFSKKILAFATRNIACRKCQQPIVKPHTCFRNHSGSSKAMEADMVVEMVLKNDMLVKANCRIRTIIGDEDSSSIAALRRLSPYEICKWSDFNHIHKTFNSKLYELKINASIREYFSKMFALCIKKHKGDETNVKLALQNLIPHAFGDHNNCGSWCTKDDNNNHHYKYFKNGECLTDSALKMKLEKVVEPFVKNAHQIAPCASSQVNESFNYTVTTKHPKSFYYGGSGSHAHRVALAVCQKNIGYEYINELYSKLDISPGKHTEKYRNNKQQCQRQVCRKNLIPTKKRRLILKKERATKNSTSCSREGIIYKSGVGYLDTSDLIDETFLIDNVDYNDCCTVIFDTETTGFKVTDEIIQIAAKCGEKIFVVYIMPTKQISPMASEKTGFKVINDNLYFFDEVVVTNSARDAFVSFLFFLKILRLPCILVAHNYFRFDAPKIIKLAESLNLIKELKSFVKGFGDTVPMFKEVLPNRKKEKKSFSQPMLVDDYLPKTDILTAHNATNDVIMLDKLLKAVNIEKSVIINNTQTISFITNSKDRLPKLKFMKNSLLSLEISKTIRSKIAKAGIDITSLKEACKTGGYYRLQFLLAEAVNNKPRVTNNKKIIKNIFTQLENLRDD